MPQRGPHPRQVYAHRGARVTLPENTLPALARALEVGADVLEIDVHMTRDGIVVVAHDDDGARMANVRRNIRDCAYSYVSTWDAGWGFTDAQGKRPFAGQGFRLPTLDAVLREFPDATFSVDAKQLEPDMTGPLLRVVREAKAQDRVRLASFHNENHVRFRARGYEGQTALSKKEAIALYVLPLPVVKSLGLIRSSAAQIPTHAGPLDFASAKVIKKMHALGLRVDYWTINDEREVLSLLAKGADGVITDDPERVVPIVRNAPASAHA